MDMDTREDANADFVIRKRGMINIEECKKSAALGL